MAPMWDLRQVSPGLLPVASFRFGARVLLWDSTRGMPWWRDVGYGIMRYPFELPQLGQTFDVSRTRGFVRMRLKDGFGSHGSDRCVSPRGALKDQTL